MPEPTGKPAHVPESCLTLVSRLKIASSGSRAEFALNTKNPPLDNKVFRQALQYALDRQRIADSVYQGLTEPVDLPFAPSSPAYDATDDHFYTFDLDKARALLASSGVTNASLDFNYSNASNEAGSTAQIYQADLAKIGVTLNLKPLDPVTTNTSIRNVSYTGMITLATLFGQLHPTMEDGNPLYSAAGTNWSNFHSDAYTALMRRLDTEIDPRSKRRYTLQFARPSWTNPGPSPWLGRFRR